jgi:hypothetical protein
MEEVTHESLLVPLRIETLKEEAKITTHGKCNRNPHRQIPK